MASFLAIAAGLTFTLVVCLLALRALLEPWLRFRRSPAAEINDSGYQRTSPASKTRSAAPLHTA
jgi:hypothetical protein